ncbi:MAG TPA: FIST N-terminal domain-containing protein [Phycisphaerales bacterium]|nr:FIST N-terminal domain-containing protein [Phycisphaerales bacterium]
MRTSTAAIETFTYDKKRGWSNFPRIDSGRTLVVAFGWSGLREDPAPLRQLREAFPTSHIVGCSTAGEIQGTGLFDETISCAAIRFEHTTLSTVSAPVRSPEDSARAGNLIAEQLIRPGLRGVLVFSDGLKVNGSELVRGLAAALPASVVITGGLAGDGARFASTWVLRGGEPSDGLVTAVGLYGDRVRIGHGSKGGWDVFGPERVVTRSRGNVLLELDGKPALPLYKNYLGDRAKELPASALLFPLSLRRDRSDQNSFVRTILGVDEKDQSLTFAGDIPQGYLAQLMRANFDRLVEGAAQSALMTRSTNSSERPCLSIAVSCVGRRLVLGERTEEELERAMEVLPQGSAQVGFYSYGEISPFATGGCDLHNQTMTLTTITEE